MFPPFAADPDAAGGCLYFISSLNAQAVSSRLGSLNHALLSLEYCLKKPLKLYGIVYNTYPKADKEIEDSTRDYLKAYLEKNFPGAKFLEMGKLEF